MDILFLGGTNSMVTESDNCVWNGVGEMQGEKGSLLRMKRSGRQRMGGSATGKVERMPGSEER